MPSDYLLGIDAGTSSTKAVLVAADGTVAAEAALPHAVDMPAPGHVEQDPDGVWWKEVVALCRTLADRAPDAWRGLRAVGVSAVGATLVPVDARGRVTHPAILYGIDTRAEREIAWLERRIGARRILRLAGRRLSAQAVGPKIFWLRRHRPDAFASTAHFLSAPGFLTYRLTGVPVVDHFSAVAWAPLFDPRRLAWRSDMAALVGGAGRLPRLAWAAEVVGGVTGEASAATGLPERLPVVAGTADVTAEALSVGVTRPGEAMLMYGSTLFIVAVVREWRPDPVFWPSIHCLPGLTTVTAGTATFGAAERWLVEDLLAAGADRARLGEEAAACAPGADGLVVLPYLSGERSPLHDPHAAGAIVGLTLRHRSAHVYRALLEGTAFSVRHNLELLEARHGRFRRLVAVGGGSQSPLWRQIVSDVTNRVQVVSRQRAGAPYGAAYLAGLGAGVFRDLRPLHETWAADVIRVEPVRGRHPQYTAPYRIYRRLYPQLRDEMHALARLRRADRQPGHPEQPRRGDTT